MSNGIKCILLRFAKNQSVDTYRLYNLATECIRKSRDVIFLDEITGNSNKRQIQASTNIYHLSCAKDKQQYTS